MRAELMTDNLKGGGGERVPFEEKHSSLITAFQETRVTDIRVALPLASN